MSHGHNKSVLIDGKIGEARLSRSLFAAIGGDLSASGSVHTSCLSRAIEYLKLQPFDDSSIHRSLPDCGVFGRGEEQNSIGISTQILSGSNRTLFDQNRRIRCGAGELRPIHLCGLPDPKEIGAARIVTGIVESHKRTSDIRNVASRRFVEALLEQRKS